MNKEKHTHDRYKQAVDFYENYPTGVYDDEAAHALACHFDLLEALNIAATVIENGCQKCEIQTETNELLVIYAALEKAEENS